MSLAEKMGYLRGLADGLNLDEAKDQQGRLLAALVDVVEELADQTTANEEAVKELNEQLDELTESLDVLETLVVDSFEDEEEDDEEEECFMTNCPECEEEVYFDESVLEDGEVICPNCGAKLEFDLSDLVNDDENEDEE